MRWLVLIAATVQIVAPFFIRPFANGQNPVQTSESSQIEPAGYAFAIWGPIYLLALAYAVWQATPAGKADPATARAAIFALILYAGSTVWLAAAQYGPLWATAPVLAAMAASAIMVLIIAADAPFGTSRWWFMAAPFALYAGWTTCATFVNIAEVLPAYGFDRFGLSVAAFGAASIGAAAIVAGLVLVLTKGSLVFAGTVLWALAAILVAAAERNYGGAVPVAAGLAAALIVMLTAYLKIAAR